MKKFIIIVASIILALFLLSVSSSREVHSEIEINASAEDVWNILINFNEYPKWNPFITNISGEMKEGSQIRVTIKPAGEDGMEFNPEILIATPNTELRWLGRILIPGIFDGEHYFKIEPISNSKVRFTQGEYFSGFLVLPLWSSIEEKTKNGFTAMNKALKIQAESIMESI